MSPVFICRYIVRSHNMSLSICDGSSTINKDDGNSIITKNEDNNFLCLKAQFPAQLNHLNNLKSCLWSLVINFCAEDSKIACKQILKYTDTADGRLFSLKSFCEDFPGIDSVIMSIEDYVKPSVQNISEKRMVSIENKQRFSASKSSAPLNVSEASATSGSPRITFTPSFTLDKSSPPSVRRYDLFPQRSPAGMKDNDKRMKNLKINPTRVACPVVFLSDIKQKSVKKECNGHDCPSPSSVCDPQGSEAEDPKFLDADRVSDTESCDSFFPLAPEVEDDVEELEHGVVSVCGRRRSMEDAVSALSLVIPESEGNAPLCEMPYDIDRTSETILNFYAVYDGHGGPQVSRFCQQNLHNMIEEELVRSGSKHKTTGQFIPLPLRIQSALRNAYLRLDDKVCGRCSRPDGCFPECNHPPITAPAVGSTAVSAVVSDSHIIVANCGDSRAVLSRGGSAIELSCDHKPNREDERRRVEAAGGCVIYSHGFRVFGVLAMSRAIGDRFLKPSVIAEPEITCTERSDDDECLILASDGLWDVMSSEEACSLAGRFMSSKWHAESSYAHNSTNVPAVMASTFLTKLAMARGSADNISVIVVDLKPKPRSV